mmetsp:Transcript_41221/g.109079  ORF Transcript_41221/g.109079 Transcript_41221/m.109079 type:complete len:219 (-) Transcript_41221:63-719(-)
MCHLRFLLLTSLFGQLIFGLPVILLLLLLLFRFFHHPLHATLRLRWWILAFDLLLRSLDSPLHACLPLLDLGRLLAAHRAAALRHRHRTRTQVEPLESNSASVSAQAPLSHLRPAFEARVQDILAVAPIQPTTTPRPHGVTRNTVRTDQRERFVALHVPLLLGTIALFPQAIQRVAQGFEVSLHLRRGLFTGHDSFCRKLVGYDLIGSFSHGPPPKWR